MNTDTCTVYADALCIVTLSVCCVTGTDNDTVTHIDIDTDSLILIHILILWIMIMMQHVRCILESFWNHVLYISCFDDVCAFLILHQNEPWVMSN
jgi:hypothetical protein